MINKSARNLFIISAVIVATATIIVWHWHVGNASLANYQTETVQLGDIAQTVTANGTLNPVVLVNVGAQVTGKVQKMYTDFNARVTAGQVLLELDPKLLKADVDQSNAELNKAQAILELAIANEKRGHSLFQQHVLARQDWEQLVQLRKSAAADVELATARLARDRTNLDYATIHSPVSGVIVDRQVDIGQTVTSGFQTPILFTIAQDLSKMQIDSSFAEADIGNIRAGQETTFTVDAFPNHTFQGIVKQIRLNPTVQQNVVTYDVVIMVDNPEGILLPGTTAYVTIKTAEHKNVLVVPNTALRFRPKDMKLEKNREKQPSGMGTIYKLVDNKLEPTSCHLGISDNRYTEVNCKNALKNGEKIVVGDLKENGTTPPSSFRIRVF
jgi:HlyD family secretion protein